MEANKFRVEKTKWGVQGGQSSLNLDKSTERREMVRERILEICRRSFMRIRHNTVYVGEETTQGPEKQMPERNKTAECLEFPNGLEL